MDDFNEIRATLIDGIKFFNKKYLFSNTIYDNNSSFKVFQTSVQFIEALNSLTQRDVEGGTQNASS